MAGVAGFEPALTVLETAVLPLTPYPWLRMNKYNTSKIKNTIIVQKKMESFSIFFFMIMKNRLP